MIEIIPASRKGSVTVNKHYGNCSQVEMALLKKVLAEAFVLPGSIRIRKFARLNARIMLRDVGWDFVRPVDVRHEWARICIWLIGARQYWSRHRPFRHARHLPGCRPGFVRNQYECSSESHFPSLEACVGKPS